MENIFDVIFDIYSPSRRGLFSFRDCCAETIRKQRIPPSSAPTDSRGFPAESGAVRSAAFRRRELHKRSVGRIGAEKRNGRFFYMVKRFQEFFRNIIVLPIRFYQKFISPFLPPSCMYEPSCSNYAMQSIQKFGFIKGFVLGTARLFRCNGAFFRGGEDPIPESFSFRQIRLDYRKFSKRRRDEG